MKEEDKEKRDKDEEIPPQNADERFAEEELEPNIDEGKEGDFDIEVDDEFKDYKATTKKQPKIDKENQMNFDPKFIEKILKEIDKNREENVIESEEKENVIMNLVPNSNEMLIFQEKQ